GKKSGRGFYIHSKGKGGKTELNTPVDAMRIGELAKGFTRDDLQERMVLLMVNEAARCLEEQVVATADDVDFGMVMGTGFAPFRGGPLRYADSHGIEKIYLAMRKWVTAGAAYFEPCALMEEMAKTGHKFHSEKSGVVHFNKAATSEKRERGPVSRSMPTPGSAGVPPASCSNNQLEPRKTGAPTLEEAPELIDTSKMSAGQRAALELTEAARENTTGSFASRMFMGKLDLSDISPFPQQSPEDRSQGDEFLRKLGTFLRERVDADEIDRTGEIPQDVMDGLAKLGAFGIKIAK